MTSTQEQFARDGYVAPVRVLTAEDCSAIRKHLEASTPPPADWSKGRAATDWMMARLAASPQVLDLIKPLLGDDIVLWGCSLVRRGPGEKHPWHVDIETSNPNGRYATIWIGLENTSQQSGLQLIAGSHHGKIIQQVQSEKGFRRGEADTETVLSWAREFCSDARLVQPALGDGEAVLFDGRLWHGSHNVRGGKRSALLLQFATADSPVRMHDLSHLDWPFHILAAPRPPAIVVHGTARGDANRLVPPPARIPKERMPMMSSCIRSFELPLAEREGGGWQPHHLFKGSTRILDKMSCHASVLSGGHCPHPPHIHPQEELFIVLDGELELVIADKPSAEDARVERISSGAFSYYPAGQHHTVRNPGSAPVTYLMFKWQVDGAKPSKQPLGASIFRYDIPDPADPTGWVTNRIFQQPTGQLHRLHCHTSWLAPGAGYEPHVDAYDVALVLLEGRVETLGEEVGPISVIYYSAGEKHGIRNIGDKPARYLVFEFHGPGIEFQTRARRRARSFAKRVLRRGARTLGLSSVAAR